MNQKRTAICEPRYEPALQTAVAAAQAAGALLLAEFLRPGGPRGPSGHCPADNEAERLIRAALRAAFPSHGRRGEELSGEDCAATDPDAHVWLIDPNDGTQAYQRGWRGPAVSIALLRGGLPVLGVVYAYAERAGAGDLFAWAEGLPFTRNGSVVPTPQPQAPDAPFLVLVSQDGDNCSAANAALCAPGRFRTVPSIAYRLALVAAGEAQAAVSLGGPCALDVAGGQALLRAAGYELLRMDGSPVTYRADGSGFVGDCVGGAPALARRLAARDWSTVLARQPRDTSSPYPLIGPMPSRIVGEAELLNRAQGCWLGQLAGDSLGALVEFAKPCEIAERYPGGVRQMADGGCWGILAGQPTDDSELALMLARSIVQREGYDPEAAARAYVAWYGSQPFDVGGTTAHALQPAQRAGQQHGSVAAAARQAAQGMLHSQANGALMRISPLAIYGHALPDDTLADLARQDALLTHASPVCQDANAVFCVAVAAALRGGSDRPGIYKHARAWAAAHALQPEVRAALEEARTGAPLHDQEHMGWVKIALHNAFAQLLHAPSLEEGIVRTIAGGGDTDTNAAIAGALLGAAWGARAFPQAWVNALLSCRPLGQGDGSRHPRPPPFWPVDALHLAERLVWLGRQAPGMTSPCALPQDEQGSAGHNHVV